MAGGGALVDSSWSNCNAPCPDGAQRKKFRRILHEPLPEFTALATIKGGGHGWICHPSHFHT